MQKADLEPRRGRDHAKIALDETVVKVNGDQYWLVAAVNPDTNVIQYVRLYSSRNTALTKMFLRGLQENHAIDDSEFLVDGAPWRHTGLFELSMQFRHETFGERNPVERVFLELKRRTTNTTIRSPTQAPNQPKKG